MEYFDPNNAEHEFRRGWASRCTAAWALPELQYLKHSIAVLFDQTNGPSSMNYNIFGDGYEPDRLILRHGFNDGWAWGGPAPSTSSTSGPATR